MVGVCIIYTPLVGLVDEVQKVILSREGTVLTTLSRRSAASAAAARGSEGAGAALDPTVVPLAAPDPRTVWPPS